MEQNRTKSKKELMIKVLGTCSGNVSEAIRLLAKEDMSVGRTTHYKWLEEDIDYKEAVDNAADATIDLVEKALISQIKNGSVQATMFYLKTKGRGRGYNEKIELETTIKEAPIQIIIEK